MLIENIIRQFKAPPAIAQIKDPKVVAKKMRHWRIRVLYSLMIGYALFYFCRKNISIALPAIGEDLGYTNMQLGLFATVLYVTYGLGKFINGMIGDKANPRYFMATGLFLSALMNIAFGLSSSLWSLALFWGINGWFQSTGVPACSRLLANWYSVSERGTFWGIWHVSHQIGAFIIAILAGYLTQYYGWRYAFYVPGVLCVITAFFLFHRLRDVPPSLGLPPISEYHKDIELDKDGNEVTDEPESIWYTLRYRVLSNKYIWLIAFMNFFIYIVRFGTFDWATKYLVETKGSEIINAGIVVSMIELAGIAAPILAGVMSDKITKGRRGPLCAVSLLLTTIGLVMFYYVPPGYAYLDAVALALIGFFIYGPHSLVGPFVTDFASRKGSATAIGFAAIFAYAGAALSGVGTGWLIDTYGWIGGFAFWTGSALAGAIITLTLWNACPVSHKHKHAKKMK